MHATSTLENCCSLPLSDNLVIYFAQVISNHGLHTFYVDHKVETTTHIFSNVFLCSEKYIEHLNQENLAELRKHLCTERVFRDRIRDVRSAIKHTKVINWQLRPANEFLTFLLQIINIFDQFCFWLPIKQNVAQVNDSQPFTFVSDQAHFTVVVVYVHNFTTFISLKLLMLNFISLILEDCLKIILLGNIDILREIVLKEQLSCFNFALNQEFSCQFVIMGKDSSEFIQVKSGLGFTCQPFQYIYLVLIFLTDYSC